MLWRTAAPCQQLSSGRTRRGGQRKQPTGLRRACTSSLHGDPVGEPRWDYNTQGDAALRRESTGQRGVLNNVRELHRIMRAVTLGARMFRYTTYKIAEARILDPQKNLLLTCHCLSLLVDFWMREDSSKPWRDCSMGGFRPEPKFSSFEPEGRLSIPGTPAFLFRNGGLVRPDYIRHHTGPSVEICIDRWARHNRLCVQLTS